MNIEHKNKFVIFLGLCVLFANNICGQQTPTFSEYYYNPFIINPAYAGLTKEAEISVSSSGFFNSFEGSPKTTTLSAHKSAARGKIGLGFGVIRDEIGVSSATSVFGAVSYKIFFDIENGVRPHWQLYTPGVLSFGLTFGFQQFQNNLLDLGIIGDATFSENINSFIPNIGFGIVYNHDTFYAGISNPNLLGDALASNGSVEITAPFYGFAGYRLYNNIFEDYIIKPNVLLKYEKGAPIQADINVSVSYRNKFELGTGYRTNQSFNFLIGFYMFKNFRAIYNYNLATNGSPVGNSNGIALSYQFGKGYYRD